jgi:hypothetical protein
MSIFATVQELGLFMLYDEFTPDTIAQYVCGIILCIVGVGIISYRPDGADLDESLLDEIKAEKSKEDQEQEREGTVREGLLDWHGVPPLQPPLPGSPSQVISVHR